MSREKEIDVNKQLKLAKVFKAVISAGLIAPVFVSAVACKERPPVVEEQQQEEEYGRRNKGGWERRGRSERRSDGIKKFTGNWKN